MARRALAGSDSTARASEIASLLRAVSGANVRSARWELVCLTFGTDREARAFIYAAIERLEPNHAALLRAIYLDSKSTKLAAIESGVTLSRLYRERRAALTKLWAEIERCLNEATAIHSFGGVSMAEMELAAAELHDRSGHPSAAIERLRSLLERAPAERYRVGALTRLAILYSKRGNAQLADRALGDARRQTVSDPRDEIDIDFAETMLASEAIDEPRLRDSLARLSQRDELSNDPHLVGAIARSMAELAAVQIARSELRAAQATLERADAVLARHPLPPIDIRTRLINVRAQLHIAVPSSIGIARAEARIALHMASRHGLAREAWLALHTLVDNHLGTLDLQSVLTYARYLEDSAQRIGESRPIAMASLILAATQAQMGATDAALRRIDACRSLAAGASDVERDLLEAYVLGLTGQYVHALEAARRARTLADSLGLVNLIGIALLYESSMLESSGTTKGVREAAEAAADVLETAAAPYHLANAYKRLHALTGEDRFRAQARTLTATFRRESDFLERLGSADSSQNGLFAGLLTPRQSEVAELVCSGKTNKQIASAIGISEPTAAHHVEAILHRLGLRARWQLLERYVG